MELFLTFYTYVCYVTQISLEAFLVTITDTGHLGSLQDALSLSQSVNCGWSKQQPLGATHHYVICPRPSY